MPRTSGTVAVTGFERADITVGDKILSALEAYNDRDVVVSVVDINSRQNQVKSVQVMAGLTE